MDLMPLRSTLPDTNAYDNVYDTVSSINTELKELEPLWKFLLLRIGLVAGSALQALRYILLGASIPWHIHLVLCIGAGYSIFSFINYQSTRNKIQKNVKSLFLRYSPEFLLSQKEYSPLIELDTHNFELAKQYGRYSPTLFYDVTTNLTLKIKGGTIGIGSPTLLEIEIIKRETNSEELEKKYQPWVDLFMQLCEKNKKLSEDNRIPKEFMHFTGYMSDLFSSYDPNSSSSSCQIGEYTCKWNHQQKCIEAKKQTEIRFIKTPEECEGFLNENFREKKTSK